MPIQIEQIGIVAPCRRFGASLVCRTYASHHRTWRGVEVVKPICTMCILLTALMAHNFWPSLGIVFFNVRLPAIPRLKLTVMIAPRALRSAGSSSYPRRLPRRCQLSIKPLMCSCSSLTASIFPQTPASVAAGDWLPRGGVPITSKRHSPSAACWPRVAVPTLVCCRWRVGMSTAMPVSSFMYFRWRAESKAAPGRFTLATVTPCSAWCEPGRNGNTRYWT